ncbi:hypothetical protein [Neorhizobium sp. T6_25]|uniref:hypothetical protein n=1 Tax=Neorhizobium sp. T6_25 TaxID=2093833 RepID=UPI000CF8D1DF|nr:hypothetical protein [Neorhizobium sp. T6_25]
MLNIEHLITVADEYGRAAQVEEKTVSSRVFQDSKKLGAIRAGSDITVGRYNAALAWFSTNWPDGAEWPHAVQRPSAEVAA